jgi:hypothetical protein
MSFLRKVYSVSKVGLGSFRNRFTVYLYHVVQCMDLSCLGMSFLRKVYSVPKVGLGSLRIGLKCTCLMLVHSIWT